MTPSTLPQSCWRPLAEVKTFVEKFPNGVDLTQLRDKVFSYQKLNKKDKQLLLNHLEKRESIFIIRARKENKQGREKTFLRHKKYGYPKSMPGYIWPREEKESPSTSIATTTIQPVHEQKMEQLQSESPEALRKQAEQLLAAAEAAEKKRKESDYFNKTLAPVKLELRQTVGRMEVKLNEFIDCMDAVNKAMQKLNSISA